MKIEMNMNYDKIEEPSLDAEYSDEILDTGWNPDVDLVCQEQQMERDEHAAMPVDLTTEIIDLFLRKMYSIQH